MKTKNEWLEILKITKILDEIKFILHSQQRQHQQQLQQQQKNRRIIKTHTNHTHTHNKSTPFNTHNQTPVSLIKTSFYKITK